MNKLKKYMVFLLVVVFMGSFSGCGFGKNKNLQTKDNKKMEEKTSTKSEVSQNNTTSKGKENGKDKTQQQQQANKNSNSTGVFSNQITSGSSKGARNNGPTLSSVKKLEGIYVSAKKAKFGSLVKVYINDKSIDKSKVAFFQVTSKDKSITKVAKISEETTIYPDQQRGTKVKVKFFDKSQKLIKTIEAIIVEDR